jgi:hypothetical protein
MSKWRLTPGIGMMLLIPAVLAACYAVGAVAGPLATTIQSTSAAADPGSSQDQSTAPSRDLSQDEQKGGHTLSRHVAKSDDDLRQRLANEQISAASTYADRQTAEQAVGAALAQNRDRIRHWLSRQGHHLNLVLDYHGDQPLGRCLRRGQSSSHACKDSVVVLKWAGPGQYFVLTSYPEDHR